MKSFPKGMKQIQHATKEPLFSIFIPKKNSNVLGIFLNLVLKGVQNKKKNYIIYDLYWILVGNFFGPYN